MSAVSAATPARGVTGGIDDVLAGRRQWWVECADARSALSLVPDGSVHACITSPPYLGLRDYGHADQIGLEATPAEYVAAMVDVFEGVRRALHPSGTLWVVIGDAYAGSWGAQSRPGYDDDSSTLEGGPTLSARQIAAHPRRNLTGSAKRTPGLKPKDLMGIPWRVAFALQDAGWWLRSDCIWSKPNPMPESVTDRPTRSHEYAFLFAKSRTYYYDHIAVREPLKESSIGRLASAVAFGGSKGAPEGDGSAGRTYSGNEWVPTGGANKRSVWTVATTGYDEAHFATFPPALVEPMVKASTSEKGVCPACGAPWRRVVETENATKLAVGGKLAQVKANGNRNDGNMRMGDPTTMTVGWRPGCTCDAGDPIGAVVLDPFAGSGTTLMTALRHGRRAIGLELNPSYCDLARRRIVSDAPMFNGLEVAAR